MKNKASENKSRVSPIKKFVLFFIATMCMLTIAACGNKTETVELNPLGSDDPKVVTIGEDGINSESNDRMFAPGVPDAGNETAPPTMSHIDDYENYRELNSDVIGWLSVPRTKIEYPVARALDNEYYLYKNVEGKESSSGTIFMDMRNTDPENDRHVIIWGHNMRNGTMFHDLTQYKHADFFNNNRDITLYLNDKEIRYEIYSAYIVNVDSNFISTEFASDDYFLTYMNELRGLCKFTPKPDVTLTKDDHILTLITCTYEYDDSRYVVQARKVS